MALREVYYERGEPVRILVKWGASGRTRATSGPRNVLIERADGSRVVRPFRGLRVRQSGPTLEERFRLNQNCGDPDECWEWQGSRTTKGYGQITVGRRGREENLSAHRLAWQFEFGPIPKDLFVCHHCDNPPCVNPKHLFLGSHDDNMRDASQKGRLRWKADDRRWTDPLHGRRGHPKGEKHWRTKLTKAQALEALAKRKEGVSYDRLAAEYGVTPTTMRLILLGKTGLLR